MDVSLEGGGSDAGSRLAQAKRYGESVDLAESLRELSELSTGDRSLKDTLTKVAEYAVRAIPGAEGAGLTLIAADRSETLVATNQFVSDVDAIQYGIRQGPCITAASDARTVLSHSLGDDKRWPTFGAEVAGLGVHSALSLPLISPDRVVGAMNIYARHRDAFDDRSAELGQLFAVPAAIAVQNAQVLSQALALVANLQSALDDRAIIDQAIGLLIGRDKLSANAAERWLHASSEARGLTVLEVADITLREATQRTLGKGSSSNADVSLPRAAMLRDITDDSVMDQVFATRRVTRAGLSASTGISKPTISESVRRLEAAGVLSEAGRQTGRRGRVATFYELASTAGWVLAIELKHDGLSSSSATLDGDLFDDGHRATPDDGPKLSKALRAILAQAQRAARERGRLHVLSLSVAKPIDQRNNEILPLMKSKFPLGMHNMAEIFDTLQGTKLMLDTSVNLAAFAERQAGVARHVQNYAYFYLGSDLGLSFLVGDEIIRGANNLVGEIGRLPVGAGSTTVIQSLIRQGFGRPDGAGLDVTTVSNLLDRAQAGDPIAGERIHGLCGSLAVPLAAVKAVLDPEIIVLGGPLGRHPYLRTQLTEALENQLSLKVELVASTVEGSGALRGALKRAIISGRHLLRHPVLGPAEPGGRPAQAH